MKLKYFKSISLLFTFLCCVANPASAALITTEFSELVGNQGTVDINLSLAGGENLNGFSLYFSENLFANLEIIASPLAWDSIVFQPDLLLGAGLFDSYNPLGLSAGFARLSFTYLADVPFQALAYDLYDADFQVIASGTTTNVTAAVPESSAIILLMLGFIALLMRRFRAAAKNIFSGFRPQQVAA